MNFIERIKFGAFFKSLTISKIDALSGVEFEKFVAQLFEYLGFKTEFTPASGDNGIDVVARNRRYSIGIQTKLYYNHNVSNKAVQEVYSGKSYYKTTYALAVSNWNFSKPALNLAKELNVGIIDRSILKNMLLNSKNENKLLIKSIIETLIGE